MRIEDIFSPDFVADKVYEFLWSNLPSKDEMPIAPPTGYVVADSARGKKLLDVQEVKLTIARREYYNVVTATSVPSKIGSFDVIVPITHTLNFTLYRNLLLRDKLSEDSVNQITAAFEVYNFKTHGDPNVYASQAMGAAGSADEFAVAYTYKLDKIGNPIESNEARNALLDLYSGTGGNGTVEDITGTVEAPTYFSRRFRIVLVKTEEIIGPAPATPPLSPNSYDHEEGQAAKPIGDVIKDFIDDQSKAFGECTDVAYNPVRERVLQLIEWPEFKIEWVDQEITIGCIKVIITIPRIYTRTGSLVLWVYVGKPKDLKATFVSIVETCAIKSALAGAVIGIVLGSLEAATASFNALFQNCVEFNAGRYLDCLYPGLMLEDEHTPWV